MFNFRYHSISGFLMLTLLSACIFDEEWNTPELKCSSETKANTTFEDVFALYEGTTVEILEDLVLEAFVISSDESGNFFNTLHLQDRNVDPTYGLQIELDLIDSHLRYEVGDKVFLYLNGLFLGRSKGIFKLGSGYFSFGNLVPGRIPTLAISRYIEKSCETSALLVPVETSIRDLETRGANTLIRLNQVEFIDEELGLPFARPQEETSRTIIDCEDNTIVLINSGYADFFHKILPEGMGNITGVYYPENGKQQLIISSLEDVQFNEKRCAPWITEFTSDDIFISEIADPDNASGARFIELAYTGQDSLSLNGWQLVRYTNSNTAPGVSIDLTGNILRPGQVFVIASNPVIFEQMYGLIPDLEGGVNSAADSNGDDTMVLIDPFGEIIDIFGLIGEDGSGTNHEFEDGKALRNQNIVKGNPVYTFSEWVIYNDSGLSGTINQPQLAPQDFSPGTRN